MLFYLAASQIPLRILLLQFAKQQKSEDFETDLLFCITSNLRVRYPAITLKNVRLIAGGNSLYLMIPWSDSSNLA